MFWLQTAFFVAFLVAAYLYWIRPVLRRNQTCAHYYEQEDSWLAAFRLRFAGIKGYLAINVGKAVAALVAVHDFLIPYATGIDWTPITSRIPDWSIPLILFGFFALIGWFRTLTDRRATEV